MILRHWRRLKASLFLTALCFTIAVCDESDAQLCPDNTFRCPKEGTCIPIEWMGDGAQDCSDGADEADAMGHVNSTEAKGRPKRPQRQESGDPFAELATKKPAVNNGRPADGCSEDGTRRVAECVQDLESWLSELSSTNFSQTSIFKDDTMYSSVQRGCQLVSQYTACMDGLPASCAPDDGPAKDWLASQTYTCELLVPSLREHLNCFSTARDPQCGAYSEPQKASAVCSLMASVLIDVECVEKIHSEPCGETLAELFGPLKMETEHALSDLQCHANVAPLSETATDRSDTPAAVEVRPTKGSGSTSENGPVKDKADLSNSLYAFGNVDIICESTSDNAWKPVTERICQHKNELREHAKCFLETAMRETKCTSRMPKRSACDAIHAFNQNVDCVIRTLNDVCPVEAQDIVVGVQEKLNDEAISLKCYQKDEASQPTPVNDDGFHLTPANPRCTSQQENAALGCLVELIEIQRQLSQFQSTDFLLEASDSNSTLITQICGLYAKYEKCLNDSVFIREGGHRCSFNSPLNTLARIGLSPVCSHDSRELLVHSRHCILDVSRKPDASQCQSGLHNLGGTVNLMLQGIHGEALLCKSFYILREAFQCGEGLVKTHCDASIATDLGVLKEQMTHLGIEEGCPAEKPSDLEAIIAKPVAQAPIARPLPKAKPVAPEDSSAAGLAAVCEEGEQQKFTACIQPLTAYQPHPIAVIKQPRLINEACEAFKKFNECRAGIKCNPLWARGMSAMFAYACGPGLKQYTQVRQCVRRTSSRTDIRECVTVFSKGAPQEACDSSNRLLSCALPPITEKCGKDGAGFVQEYIRVFSTTIDPACRMEDGMAVKAVMTSNCTAAEDQLVQHCAAPLSDIAARLEELFQGGQQAFLKNVNNLAPIFAQGCTLTKEFRECARSVLEKDAKEEGCVVSSCLMRAGHGICNRENVSAAIDENLGCIFKQVSDPNFGKCLVSTLASLKQFTIAALKGVLPKFIACIEPIVIPKCGEVPINVLKALSSQDVCPIRYADEPVVEKLEPIKQEVQECTEQMSADYSNCTGQFYKTFGFEPITLLQQNHSMDEVCTEDTALSACLDKLYLCEKQPRLKALRKMISQLCSSRNIFDEHRVCLNQAVQSAKGKECLAKYHRDEENKSYCSALSFTADCLASKINSDCGADALSFVYNAMNTYVHELSADSKCALSVPSVSLETGCSEQHLIQYLECETIVDKFRFRPVTFISNASKWDEFCSTVTDKYRPCLDNLECKFEPVSTASLTLFENLCEREVTRRDQRTNAECLAKVADSEPGKKCLDAFNGVDLLARDAGMKLCDSVNSILRCIANDIELQCGGEALLHVYDIHYTWVHAFNSTCSLAPENNKAPTKDQDKTIVSPTQAPSSKQTPTTKEDTVQKTTDSVQKAHAEETPVPEPHPEPEPEPEPTPEPTSVPDETTTLHAHDHNELPTEKPDDTKGNGSGTSCVAAYWKTVLPIATLLIFIQCRF